MWPFPAKSQRAKIYQDNSHVEESQLLSSGMEEVRVSPWKESEIEAYIRKQSGTPTRFVYQYPKARKLFSNLRQATGGYPRLINAYLHSAEYLYSLYWDCPTPKSINDIYERVIAPGEMTDTIRETAKNLAASFLSLLSDEQKSMLCEDITNGRHCRLNDCFNRLKCSHGFEEDLNILKYLGIWHDSSKSECPLGTPLIAVCFRDQLSIGE